MSRSKAPDFTRSQAPCCEPPPEAYSSIARLSAAGHNGLIIETRPEQEIAWTKLVQEVRADMPILLCSVKAPRQ